MKVVVNDKPWRELVNLAKKLAGARVRVGWFDGDLARIATIHEYGAPEAHIPERSSIRSTMRDRREELTSLQAKIAKLIFAGKIDERRAMDLLGAWLSGAIKARIIAGGGFAPLAPATVRAKGSSKPLIDTGQLVSSVTFVVVD